MPGNKIGGIKARDTNYERYGKDFYKRMGQKGGMATGTKGFAANPELAKKAGAIGGSRSRRGPAKKITAREYVSIKIRCDDGLCLLSNARRTGYTPGIIKHVLSTKNYQEFKERLGYDL